MQIKGVMLASLAVFLIVVLAKAQFGTSTEEELAAFHEEFPNKEACLGKTMERMAPCTSQGCEQLVFTRLQKCLEQAQGDKEEFCETVGNEYEYYGRDDEFFTTYCAPHTKHRSECSKLLNQLGVYCYRTI